MLNSAQVSHQCENPSWFNVPKCPQLCCQYEVLVTATPSGLFEASPNSLYSSIQCHTVTYIAHSCLILFFPQMKGTMSDKSDLKAELERKKQRLAQIREEKKRKEEERKKKEVRKKVSKFTQLALVLNHTLHSRVLFVCLIAFCQAMAH